MRKSFFLAILLYINALGFSQTIVKKQTLIPLNNTNGVPFIKDPDIPIDLIINGFEVDSKGNFYFFGGKTACLAAFAGTKQIFRKNYKQLGSGTELHSFKGYFYNYAFNYKGDLVFIKINMSDGSLDNLHTSLISKHSVAHTIIDSCVILRTMASNSNDFIFDKYDLSGNFLKKVANEYDIPVNIFPDKKESSDWDLAGMWNGNYIFWSVNSESSKYERLCVVNKDGKVLAIKSLPDGFSGEGYAENPEEDRKVRNGSLFVLGRKGKYALITEVPLKSLFKL